MGARRNRTGFPFRTYVDVYDGAAQKIKHNRNDIIGGCAYTTDNMPLLVCKHVALVVFVLFSMFIVYGVIYCGDSNKATLGLSECYLVNTHCWT